MERQGDNKTSRWIKIERKKDIMSEKEKRREEEEGKKERKR